MASKSIQNPQVFRSNAPASVRQQSQQGFGGLWFREYLKYRDDFDDFRNAEQSRQPDDFVGNCARFEGLNQWCKLFLGTAQNRCTTLPVTDPQVLDAFGQVRGFIIGGGKPVELYGACLSTLPWLKFRNDMTSACIFT